MCIIFVFFCKPKPSSKAISHWRLWRCFKIATINIATVQMCTRTHYETKRTDPLLPPNYTVCPTITRQEPLEGCATVIILILTTWKKLCVNFLYLIDIFFLFSLYFTLSCQLRVFFSKLHQQPKGVKLIFFFNLKSKIIRWLKILYFHLTWDIKTNRSLVNPIDAYWF